MGSYQKADGITLSQLNNTEYTNFMNRVLTLLTAGSISKLTVTNIVNSIKPKLVQMEDLVNRSTANAETKDLLKLDAERDFLRRINTGGEAMREEDQQQVRDIAARRRWRDPTGEEQSALSEDEVANLSIRAGTLNAEEREIINHHIVATVRMLEQLPWPKHLRKVPEYAGGHQIGRASCRERVSSPV